MKRQVLVIRNATRTVDIPLLQYSDTTVDVPVAKDAEKTPQKQQKNCMTKHNEIQMDKKLRSREVNGGTKTNCDLKEIQSEFSGTRRLKDLAKKHSECTQERESRYTLYNIDYTSEDGCSQTKLTCQENVPERIVEQIIEVLVPLSILKETVAVMKLAPHEHPQTGPDGAADAEDS